MDRDTRDENFRTLPGPGGEGRGIRGKLSRQNPDEDDPRNVFTRSGQEGSLFKTRQDTLLSRTTIGATQQEGEDPVRIEKPGEADRLPGIEDLPEGRMPDPLPPRLYTSEGFSTLEELETFLQTGEAGPDFEAEAAREFSLAGQLDRAASLVAGLLARDSLNAEARVLEAGLLYRRGDLPEARQRLESFLDVAWDANALLLLSHIQEQQGQGDDALDIILRSVSRGRRVAEHFVRLSELYLSIDNLDLATKTLIRGIGLDPNRFEYKVNLALLFHRGGFTQEAMFLLQEVVVSHSDRWEIYHTMGALYESERLYPEALWCYSNALAAVSDEQIDPFVRVNLARIQALVGDLDGAISNLKHCLEMDGNDAPRWLDLSLLYRAAGQFWDAIEAVSSSLKLDRMNPRSYAHLGQIYIECGEEELLNALSQEVSEKLPQSRGYVERMFARVSPPAFVEKAWDLANQPGATPGEARTRTTDRATDSGKSTGSADPGKTLSEAGSGQKEDAFSSATLAPGIGGTEGARLTRNDDMEVPSGTLTLNEIVSRTLAEEQNIDALPDEAYALVDLAPGEKLKKASEVPQFFFYKWTESHWQFRVDEIIKGLELGYEPAEYRFGSCPEYPGEFQLENPKPRKPWFSDPDRADSCFYMGLDLVAIGEDDRARVAFEAALSFDSNFPGTYLELARLSLRQGDEEGAFKHVRRSVQIDPENAPALLLLGELYRRRGQLRYAVESFREAYRNDTTQTKALLLIGITSETMGEKETAAHYLRWYVEQEPTDPIGYRELTRMLDDHGLVDEGLEVVKDSTVHKVDQTEVHHNHAVLLYRKQLYEKVAEVLEPIVASPDAMDMSRELLALAFARMGRVEDSLTQFDQILQRHPTDGDAHFNRGTACLWMGRLEDAVESLSRAIELDPDRAAAHLNLGAAQMKLRDFKGAMGSFEEVRRLAPDDPDALLNLGVARQESNDAAGAISAYREIMIGWPEYGEAEGLLLNLAQAYDSKDDRQRAISQYKNVLFLNPESESALTRMEDIYQLLGDGLLSTEYQEVLQIQPSGSSDVQSMRARRETQLDDEARKALEETEAEISKLDPSAEAAWAWYNIGNVHLGNGSFERALSCLDRSIGIESGLWEAHLSRGLAFHLSGRFEEAIESYAETLSINPDSFTAGTNLGAACLELGEARQAIEVLQVARRRIRSSRMALDRAARFEALVDYDLGLAFEMLGETSLALAFYDRARTRDPSLMEASFNRGRLLFLAGDTAGAVEDATRALEAAPGDVPSYILLSQALRGKNRLGEALAVIRSGLMIHPRDADLLEELALAYLLSDRHGDGKKLLATALKSYPDRPRSAVLDLVYDWSEEGLEVHLSDVLSLVSRRPTIPDFHVLTGLVMEAAGRSQEAQGHLVRAAELAEEQGDLGVWILARLAWMGSRVRSQEATAFLGDLNQLVSTACDDPRSWIARARFFLAHGRVRQALDDLRHATRMAPHREEPVLLTAEALILGEKPDRARALLESRMRDMSRDDIALLDAMARLQQGDAEGLARLESSRAKHPVRIALFLSQWAGIQGNADRAVLEALAAHEAQPENPEPLVLLSRHLHDAGQFAAALTFLTTAARLRPGCHGISYNQALLLERLDQGSQALAIYRALEEVGVEDGEIPFHEAILLGSSGEFAAAISAIERSASRQPLSPEGFMLAGELSHEIGSNDEALGLYREALARDPKGGRSRLALARFLELMGRVEQARGILERGFARNLLDAEGRLALAENLMRDQPGRSWNLLTEISRTVGDDDSIAARASCLLGDLASRGEDYGLALSCYERAREQDPLLVEAWAHAGLVARILGQPAAAEKSYQRALELDPRSDGVTLNMACLVLDGHGSLMRSDTDDLITDPTERALVVLERGLTKTPESADLLVARGALRARQSAFDGARDDLDRALVLDPDHPEGLVNRSQLALLEGRPEDALAWLDHALAQNPAFAEARINRVAALCDLGQLDMALDEAERLARDEPDSIEAGFNLVHVLMSKNMPDLASATLDVLATRLGDAACVWELKGRVNWAAGRLDDAIHAFARAGELEPDRIQYALDLARIHRRMGQPEMAAKVFDLLEFNQDVPESFWHVAGLIAMDLDSLESSQRIHEQGLQLMPLSLPLNVNYLATLVARGKLELAIAHFESLSGQLADSPGALLNVGIAHVLSGHHDLARAHIEAASDRLEQRHAVAGLIGLLDLISGDFDKAVLNFRRAGRHDPEFTPYRTLTALSEALGGRLDRIRDLAVEVPGWARAHRKKGPFLSRKSEIAQDPMEDIAAPGSPAEVRARCGNQSGVPIRSGLDHYRNPMGEGVQAASRPDVSLYRFTDPAADLEWPLAAILDQVLGWTAGKISGPDSHLPEAGGPSDPEPVELGLARRY